MKDSTAWLLEDNAPGVRLRALTELCDLPEEDEWVLTARQQALDWLPAAHDLSWLALTGLAIPYNLTALAECGLRREDVPIQPLALSLLETPFDGSCGFFLQMRALVMLGYGAEPTLAERLSHLTEIQLPDGGWLCLHRLRKMDRTPKSCYKANLHALLLAGELYKRGFSLPGLEGLLHYFFDRHIFYRSDDPTSLVLDCQPGKRTIDVFFPIEVMRVGLPLLVEAFAALGVGDAPELKEAWSLMEQKCDPEGRLILEGTLAKSYLPRERVGKPSKWATLYAYLAWKWRVASK